MKNNTSIIIVLVALALVGYFFFIKSPVPEAVNTNDDVSSTKLDMDVVCNSALSYMSFPDGASADKFVAECKAGEYPEVLERYKEDNNLGDGVAI